MSSLDHTPSFICSHIFQNSHPVLLVSKADGDLQFLCGGEHDENEKPHVVGAGHILARDPSLIELLNVLKDDQEAEREQVGLPWIINPIDNDD